MMLSTPKSVVLLATRAPAGVIFYRKSRLVTYCFRLEFERSGKRFRNRLTKGSRFYGRIFPLRSDVSPDGSLLVYFAMRGKLTDGTRDPATWTAVCSPPWLKAHLFFQNGSTWGGGGHFLDGKRLIVHEAKPRVSGPEYAQFRDYIVLYDFSSLNIEELKRVNERQALPMTAALRSPVVASKDRGWSLLRHRNPGNPGCYNTFRYELMDRHGKVVSQFEPLVDANSAGWDHFGRLVIAKGSRIDFFEFLGKSPPLKSSSAIELETLVQ